ncbi:MAG: aldo/keto reductase [Candidatus Kariarchaeaceae archaeon]|jgi:aryl-alcohol dehydrogenase-like predicted oxidoreductase
MDKHNLGNTDIEVSPIGIGVMQFSGGGGLSGRFFPIIEQEKKNAIIKVAIDGGVNWFDSAELYGRGISERSLSDALKNNNVSDSEVVIATKWMPFFRTAKNIRKTIAQRLLHLNGYSIDLYYVHMPWSFSTIKSQMNAMADLVDNGKIKAVGISNFSAKQMQKAHDALEKRGLPLAANQVSFSLLKRNIETNGVLDLAKELGVTIVAYTPLGSGILTGKYHKDPSLLETKHRMLRRRIKSTFEKSKPLLDVLESIAANYQVTPGQVALNWLVTFHGDTVVTIPGASKVKHAEESAGAMKFSLTKSELDEINEISNMA